MRKMLASVQEILDIEPIKGADRIETASVLGWKCVVPKGVYRVGEKIVYFEIDSFLPVRKEFEFLRKSSYKNSEILGEGFRIKTQTLRGQLSQGLVMKLGDFGLEDSLPLKTDLTDVLGVKEWEIPETATDAGTIIGGLPYGIPKTNEVRVQTEPELLQEFNDIGYYITTKLDGTSCSLEIDIDGNFRVTGHNYEYKDDGKSSFYKMVKDRNAEEKLRKYIKEKDWSLPVSVQGELCSPGIQGNHLKLKKPEWSIFTVNVDGYRTDFDTIQDVAKALGFPTVPLEETGIDLPSKYRTIDELLERARGEYPNGGDKEGIVIRPTTPVRSETIGSWLSMKVINNDYIGKKSSTK